MCYHLFWGPHPVPAEGVAGLLLSMQMKLVDSSLSEKCGGRGGAPDTAVLCVDHLNEIWCGANLRGPFKNEVTLFQTP